MFIAPLTLRRCSGVVVPMPTLVSAVAPLTLLMLPRTSELLCATDAFAPMAVALMMLGTPFALAPMKVLEFSVVLEEPAPFPKKELLDPVVLAFPVLLPKKLLPAPVVLLKAVWYPKKELSDAV